MDKYRVEIRRRQAVLALAGIFFLLLITLPRYLGLLPEHNAVVGFQCGLSSAALMACAFRSAHYGRALKDGALLRRMYVKEHDERLQAVRAKAGLPLTFAAAALLLAAGIIAGYFNFTVFCTLTAAAMFLMLLSAAVKAVCLKKVSAPKEQDE